MSETTKGSIIVPLDGTFFGENAIPYALSIARRANLPVYLVHVHENFAPIYEPAFASAGDSADHVVRLSGQDYLQGLRERTRFDQDVEMETAVIEGDIAEALGQYARDVKASLIVMSTDDRSALRRFLLGSVADQMLRTTLPPLLLVHPGNEEMEGDVDVHLNHLLLPLESAADSEGILKPALELSELFDGDCTLFHVVDEAPDYPSGLNSTALPHGLGESCCQGARAHFENLAGMLREQGHEVSVKIVESSYPAAGVLEEVESGKADWIAISSQRRPRLSQLMFGGTADKIIHDAKVPIFVYLREQKRD